jgi:hypothetical protein
LYYNEGSVILSPLIYFNKEKIMLPCCPFLSLFDHIINSSREENDFSTTNSSRNQEKGIDLPHCVVYLKSFKIQLKDNAGSSEKDLTSIFSIALKLFGKEQIYCEVNLVQRSLFFYKESATAPLRCLTFFPRSQSGSRSLMVVFGEEQASKQVALIRKIKETYQKVDVTI